MKPTAMYGAPEPSTQAICMCHDYALQKLAEAQDNGMVVCDMQPFSVDDFMHGVVITHDGLECHHVMEFQYLNMKVVAS